MWTENKFTELIGKTFSSVEKVADDKPTFTAEDGSGYSFYHCQDCRQSCIY